MKLTENAALDNDGRSLCNTRIYTLCLKKGYHPTTNDNFNNSCLIPVVYGTNIAE